MYTPLNSFYQSQIQIYNRVLFIIIALIPILKGQKFSFKIPISFKRLVISFILGIIPMISGTIIFEEASFKPLAYFIIFLTSTFIPINKNLINQLFKIFIYFFILETIFLIITGWRSSLIAEFYIWRPIPIINFTFPRLFGPLMDTHTSWTLFSYLYLLKIIFDKDNKSIVKFNLLTVLSFNIQVAIQNFFTTAFAVPNIRNSLFNKSLKNLKQKKLNFLVIYILIVFLILIALMASIGYLDFNNQFSIFYAINQMFNFEEFLKPLLDDNSIFCVLTGCALKEKFFSDFSGDLGIYYFFSDIGLIRILYEYGIFYIVNLFLLIERFLGRTILVFFFFGLFHYPIVMGIPFAFYVPYLYRCAKYRNTIEAN